MPQNPIELGHAAWVWVKLDAIGPRWELAIPHDMYGEPEPGISFPLREHEDMLENYADCVMRKVEMPAKPPSEAEIEMAERAAAKASE